MNPKTATVLQQVCKHAGISSKQGIHSEQIQIIGSETSLCLSTNSTSAELNTDKLLYKESVTNLKYHLKRIIWNITWLSCKRNTADEKKPKWQRRTNIIKDNTISLALFSNNVQLRLFFHTPDCKTGYQLPLSTTRLQKNTWFCTRHLHD